MNDFVPGNLYDKYSTRNPIARLLFGQFLKSAKKLINGTEPRKILDVGCGEGYFSRLLLSWIPGAEIWAIDRSERVFDSELAKIPRLHFSVQSAYQLAFPQETFDLVVALEVLEHLDNPARALEEISRVSRQNVMLSVPREPVWRFFNMARLTYLPELGNTPGHVQHWSRKEFVQLATRFFDPLQVLAPLPWTMVLAGKSRMRHAPGTLSRRCGRVRQSN